MIEGIRNNNNRIFVIAGRLRLQFSTDRNFRNVNIYLQHSEINRVSSL